MSLAHAYAELGVPPGASESQVKAAWRRQVSRWHPDRNPSVEAAALMQRINGAYERIRLAAVDAGAAAPADDAAAAPQGAPACDEAPGRSVQRRVRLALEDAAFGCTRVLRGRWTEACAACEGRGTRAAAKRCTQCDGAGAARPGWWFNWLAAPTACAACAGRGVVQPPCLACEGEGRLTHRYRRTIRFPAGLRQGDVLSAAGGGRERGGFDGTLELRVELSAHPFFVAGDGGSLRCEVPVDGFAWIAEAWTEVPTLTGVQQMRLKRGRHVYRLRGQGLPLERGSERRGDLVVTIVPGFPDTPSPRQRELLEQLAATAGTSATAATRQWQARLRAWARGREAARAEA